MIAIRALFYHAREVLIASPVRLIASLLLAQEIKQRNDLMRRVHELWDPGIKNIVGHVSMNYLIRDAKQVSKEFTSLLDTLRDGLS